MDLYHTMLARLVALVGSNLIPMKDFLISNFDYFESVQDEIDFGSVANNQQQHEKYLRKLCLRLTC